MKILNFYLTKLAQLNSPSLDEVETAVRGALDKHTAARQVGRGSEKMHIRIGPDVHYGVGQFGAHFGLKERGKPPVHLYRQRIYTGKRKKGKNVPLTPEEKERIGELFMRYRGQLHEAPFQAGASRS